MFDNLVNEDGSPIKEKLRSPPKQFTFVIPAGAIETINYQLNYFRILTLENPSSVVIRFGQTGSETDVVGAGVGYELPFVVNNVYIRNTSGAPITITVAVAVGRIYDDRLNVSGTVLVDNTAATGLHPYAPVIGTVFANSTAAGNYHNLSAPANCISFSVQNLGPSDLWIVPFNTNNAANVVATGQKIPVNGVYSCEDGITHTVAVDPAGATTFYRCAWKV